MKKEQLKRKVIKVKKVVHDEIIGCLPIKISNKDAIIKNLKKEIKELNNTINKEKTDINIYESKFSNSKCWWCKHGFESKSLGMPTCYMNKKFMLEGNFCSFNCMLSYSIDLKDNEHWKRKSLIKYFYYKTFGEYKTIYPAPHWKSLIDFGGPLTIDNFRDELILHSKEYILLEPPIIPRTTYIEELKRIKKSDDKYVLKRSKPIKSNIHNINNFLS